MNSDTDLSASRLYEEAYDLMVNDQFEKALEIYTLAIEKSDKTDLSTRYNYYIGRSQANLKLNRFNEALQDSQLALDLVKNDSRAYLKKGIALFNLKQYASALEALEEGLKTSQMEVKKELFTEWINKCKSELPSAEATNDAKVSSTNTTDNEAATAKTAIKVAPIKYEWYQTESSVTVCILVKNLGQDDLKIETEENKLTVESKDQEKIKINFHFNLSHRIEPKDTQIKYLSTKVEIKLKKSEGNHWSALELNAEQLAARKAQSNKPQYPSSSKNPKNWDKIVADATEEEKNEKLEGDAALNNLFQQIYSSGSDETRRAMNKSFMESGGTVLSTNWKDVGEKKVDIKPPDGMEWKKWDN